MYVLIEVMFEYLNSIFDPENEVDAKTRWNIIQKLSQIVTKETARIINEDVNGNS